MNLSGVMIDGAEIEVRQSFWTGKTDLKVNGTPAMKLGARQFRTEEEGAAVRYTVKGNLFSGFTVEADNGNSVLLSKNTWYDWVMIVLPVLGIVFGAFCGVIGGVLSVLFGCFGAYINAHLIRSRLSLPPRILLQVFTAVAAVAVWFGLYLCCLLLFF